MSRLTGETGSICKHNKIGVGCSECADERAANAKAAAEAEEQGKKNNGK